MTFSGDLNSETREDIPLKSGKKSKWFFCSEDYLSGSKYLNVSFGTLTVIITIALFVQIYYGDYQTRRIKRALPITVSIPYVTQEEAEKNLEIEIVPHGSVATDSLECSNIGTHILKQGGNGVDAAIASAFCLAVTTPHVTGLDAGGVMMIYNHRVRLRPKIVRFGENGTDNSWPRMVSGLLYVHKRYGILPWETLFQPSVNLARQGFLVTKQLEDLLKNTNSQELFGNLKQGQVLKQASLANTLTQLATIKESDVDISTLENKVVRENESDKLQFYKYNIFIPNTSLLESTFISILQDIQLHNFTKTDIVKLEYINKLVDLTKKAYEEKNVSTVNNEESFSNIAVMDNQDNYVSLVTGFRKTLGTGKINPDGYILDIKKDAEFDRFPIMITDAHIVCGRRFVFGANNIFEALQIIVKLIIAKENATDSVESPRFVILNNGTTAVEDLHSRVFEEDVVHYLKTSPNKPVSVSEFYHSINIVEKSKDDLKSHSDSRGGGIASRY